MKRIYLNIAIALYSLFLVIRALYFLFSKNEYRRFADYCWLARVSNLNYFKIIGKNAVKKYIKNIQKTKTNNLITSFRKSTLTSKYENKYSIKGKGKQDIFRDIIVVKSFNNNEKGVVLLKYAITFEAFIYFFDIEKLLDKYIFILEPCWAGYYNTNILMWIFPNHLNCIVVQCYTEEDYKLIFEFNPYLIPVKLGPADWVNAEIFKPSEIKKKKYDLIMVANWSEGKKHRILFDALKNLNNRKINVLLIGYAWDGRSKEDIRRESKIIRNPLIHIYIEENLSHDDVVKRLNDSKIFVFLSQKEGDNKALVEAMFANVPVVVYKNTVGGAGSRVNDDTGIFSSYEDLDKNIMFMLDNYKNYNPRQWALENTGSLNSTLKLNALLKRLANDNGDHYATDIVEKINSPNLAYKDDRDREKFEKDYSNIMDCKI